MKICSKCKQMKPLSEFNKRLSSSDGYSYNCRECTNTIRYEQNAWKKCRRCYKFFKRERGIIGAKAQYCPPCFELRGIEKEEKKKQVKKKQIKKKHPSQRKYCVLCDREVEDYIVIPSVSKRVTNRLRRELFNLDCRFNEGLTNNWATDQRFHSGCLKLLSRSQRRQLEFKDFQYRVTWIPRKDAEEVYEKLREKGIEPYYQDSRLFRQVWSKLDSEGNSTGEFIDV